MIMFDDFFDMNPELRIHFICIINIYAGHLFNDRNYFSEYLRFTFFHERHKILYLLFFRFIDDHLITFLHEGV